MAKRKTKPKAKKKTAKQVATTARRKALKDWSAEVRTRDGYRCVVCGSEFRTQAHHCLEKFLYKSTMFDPKIGLTLCPTHHHFGKYSAERNPIWWVDWLTKNRPETLQYCKENMECL